MKYNTFNMQIHATPQELIRNQDHPLWWMVSRNYFEDDILSCGAMAYAEYASIPADVRGAGGKMRRYNRFMEELHLMFSRNYNSATIPVLNQYRFFINGPQTTQIQVALRRGTPAPDGFETAHYGAATEQHSRLPLDCLPFNGKAPVNVGLLLLHDLCQELEHANHLQMWMAHEWQAEDGSDFIWCKECAYLGRMRYDSKAPVDREPTGDVPDL